jgi:hypothetical protein
MKRIFTVVAALLMTASVWAQAPGKMNYQAVVRDASNALVTSQGVGMQLSILQGSVTGTAVYVETQTPTTNINGLVSIKIGSGTVASGTFNTIDWSAGPYFIKTETDPTGGATYTITGTSQLMSVPYALHANLADSIVGGVSITETDPVFGASIANGITALDTANWNNQIIDTDTQLDSTDIASLGYNAGGITTEVDGSVTNEIQDLQLSGNNLTITNNGTATTIDLSPYLDYTDTQLDETAVDAFVANNGYLATEVDGSVTNEIQDLQLSGNNLTITNNGTATTIDLSPYLDNTDTQLDETAVDAFVANNGYLATEVDGSITNEIQTISRTGTTVTLSNGGGTFTDNVGVYTAGTGIDITDNVISTTGTTGTTGGSPIYTIGLNAALGGYVFYVTIDGKHGLVAETQNQATSVTWYPAQNSISNPANHSLDGKKFSDWRMPTKYELNEMYLQNAAIGGFTSNEPYWSSTTTSSENYAWIQSMVNGYGTGENMYHLYHVRAVRAF